MIKYLIIKKTAGFMSTALLAVTFLQAQPVVKVQPGETITTTGGVVISLQDMDLDNDGAISQPAGSGSFVFSGTADNIITGTATPLFSILQIAKTGGAKISLQQNVEIASGITFTSGLIDLNGNNILLQPAALLNGESETSRITGSNGGYVEITRHIGNTLGVDPGNLGAVFITLQDLGSTRIRRGHVSQTNSFGNGSSIHRYYDITPSVNNGLSVNMRIEYFDTELNSLDENGLVFWKSDDHIHWTSQGFSSRNTALNFVMLNGIQDFSRFTLSSAGNALPLRFLLFTVRCLENSVAVTWKTVQEQNTGYFAVERSADGISWSAIATVPAAGNSTAERSYAYTDHTPLPGNTAYRIAAHDMDGRITYTGINRTDCGSTSGWKAWPNPVQEMFNINITTAVASPVTIRVFDSKGMLIRAYNNTLQAGSNQLQINMTSLPAGVYHVIATWNYGAEKKNIQVMKR